jgi:hypothetical protein
VGIIQKGETVVIGEPTGMVGRIAELLRQHPEGLTSGEIREKLGLAANEQSQLDRRRRDVRKWYHLIVIQNGGNPKYCLGAKREASINPTGINGRLRAEVDHKIPQAWGGTNEVDNLWALCEECNHGKKDLFASQDDKVKCALNHDSVHVRIGELLKLNFNSWVPSQLIEFVANQDDWKKRTRELRYLDWEIEVKRQKQASGRVTSSYMLTKFGEWPEDPTKWIRQFEKERAESNKANEAADE